MRSNFGPRRGGFNSGPRRSGGFGRNFGGPREMHKIKCSECGKEAEVPFKPTEGRPVYCRECFMKQKGISPKSSEDSDETDEESEDFDKSDEPEEEF